MFGLRGDGEPRGSAGVDCGVGDLFPGNGGEDYSNVGRDCFGVAVGGLFYTVGKSGQLGDCRERDECALGFCFRTGGWCTPASGTVVRGDGVFGYFRGKHVALSTGGVEALPGDVVGMDARDGIQCPFFVGIFERASSAFRGTDVTGFGTGVEYSFYFRGDAVFVIRLAGKSWKRLVILFPLLGLWIRYLKRAL